jgi:hypothetical protein
MAEKDKDEKNVEVKGEAEVSGDVEAGVEFEGKAKITTPAESKQVAGEEGAATCIECGTVLWGGRCINADCSIAQAQATKGAARDTAKAAATGRPAAAPAAVSSRGRPD